MDHPATADLNSKTPPDYLRQRGPLQPAGEAAAHATRLGANGRIGVQRLYCTSNRLRAACIMIKPNRVKIAEHPIA
jgi:hypothetical protein